MDKRIVIMAGGTGGHVFPALAVALEMRRRGWQVSWLGTHRGIESRIVPQHEIEIDWLSVSGLRGKGLFSKLTGVFRLLQACWEALRILRKRRPQVVLGMGGFVAGPGGLISWLLGIPLLIHEQNRVPGTTNRLLAKRARVVLEAFPASFADSVKAVCTGNPLRDAFRNMPIKSVWQPQSGRALHVLIVGGSQGAQRLNEVIPSALSSLTNIEVRHQSGSAMQQVVQQQYDNMGITAQTEAFIEEMVAAYQWADLVVCRAGAMTVSEVAAAGLPALFVPLPNAIDDHQTANACYLSDAGAGVILKQQQLTAAQLAQTINGMIERLAQMSNTARTLAKLDATQRVADLCEQEAA